MIKKIVGFAFAIMLSLYSFSALAEGAKKIYVSEDGRVLEVPEVSRKGSDSEVMAYQNPGKRFPLDQETNTRRADFFHIEEIKRFTTMVYFEDGLLKHELSPSVTFGEPEFLVYVVLILVALAYSVFMVIYHEHELDTGSKVRTFLSFILLLISLSVCIASAVQMGDDLITALLTMPCLLAFVVLPYRRSWPDRILVALSCVCWIAALFV